MVASTLRLARLFPNPDLMAMKKILLSLFTLVLVTQITPQNLMGADNALKAYLKNPKTGGLELKNAGNLHAGTHGLLLVAEQGGSIVAIDTGDRGVFKPFKGTVKDIGKKVAGAIGAKSANINDLAVNPETGTIYLSIRRSDGLTAILTVDGDGKIDALQKHPAANHINDDLCPGSLLNNSSQCPHVFSFCHHAGHAEGGAVAKENIRKTLSNHCPESIAIQGLRCVFARTTAPEIGI